MKASVKSHIDWYVLTSVVGLMLFSIAFVYSASATIAEVRFGSPERLFWSHIIRIFFALVLLIAFAKLDYRIWRKLSKPGIFIALIPLVLVFLIGHPINGAYRWLDLGPFNFQPSELAKFALVIHLAVLLTERREVIRDFKLGVLPLLLWTLLICGLIAIEPNLSTATVIMLIAISMMLIGNTNVKHIIYIGCAALVGGGLFAISASYRVQRLMSFLGLVQGGDYSSEVSYQTQQAVLAFGNGGFFGQGPGHSQQSHLFLPESYGDFIFSVIGEEYGFVGIIILLSVFVLIFTRGIKIAKNAPDMFGYYLASGIVITFAVYTFVSAGVNCGLLPTTGLPMPFVSYGGTAVMFYAAAMGTLLNISKQSGVFTSEVKKIDATEEEE